MATDAGNVAEDEIVPDRAAVGRGQAAAWGDLTRRSLLAAAGIAVPLLVAGCKGIQVLGSPPPPPADVRVLRAAISAEEVMVARYAAAVRNLDASRPTRPTRADTAGLTAVRDVQAQHAEHLAQLRSRLVEPSGSSRSPSRSPSVQVTGSLSEVLSMLEQAEQTASDRLLSQLGGLPGSLAQLFASVAAAEATHVPFLHAAGQAR